MTSDISQFLEENKKVARFRGFRHMVNWNPSNDAEVVTDMLKDPQVKENLKRLEEADVTFELHLNPHQYGEA